MVEIFKGGDFAHEDDLKHIPHLALASVLNQSALAAPVPPFTPNEKWEGINTLFYVDFTPGVADAVRPELRKLKKDMLNFRAWGDSMAETVVTRKRQEGVFKSDEGKEDEIAIASYRAKVLESVYRQRARWLAGTVNIHNSQTMTIRSSDLHENILKLALKGFPVPGSVTSSLEDVIKGIVDSIRQTKGYQGATQYSIIATVYVYDHVAQTLDPKIRQVRFESNTKTYDVAVHKDTVQEVTITMTFSGAEWDFDSDIWDKIYPQIDPAIISDGVNLARPDANFDVAL